MPYDPRPVSQGGNRGIDEAFSRIAPAGKFKIIGVDTFDGGDWEVSDPVTHGPLYFDSLLFAGLYALRTAGSMNMRYVYDDQGECRFGAGTF